MVGERERVKVTMAAQIAEAEMVTWVPIGNKPAIQLHRFTFHSSCSPHVIFFYILLLYSNHPPPESPVPSPPLPSIAYMSGTRYMYF